MAARNPDMNIDSDYAMTTLAATFSGTTLAANLTGNVILERNRNTVTVHLPAIGNALAGAGAASTIAMTAIPAQYRPPAAVNAYPAVVSNGAAAVGRMNITTAGVTVFAADSLGTGTFNQAAAQKGWDKQTLTYSLV
jgi:hypothetical protein